VRLHRLRLAGGRSRPLAGEVFPRRAAKGTGKVRQKISQEQHGVVAKRRDLPYESGERTGMQKIKQLRTADCVVGGFRFLDRKPQVGSLLLGLYNQQGKLDHIGFTSSISAKERPELTRKLQKLVKPPGFTGKSPGGPSRWSTKRSAEWQPLSPKLVAEVQFDHFTGGRFRHGTKFLRWRPDKDPADCTLKQVEREDRSAIKLL
jgi:ATP-dependent DNA ligase